MAEVVLSHVFCGFLPDITEVRRMLTGNSVEFFLAFGVPQDKAVFCAVFDQPLIQLGIFHIIIFKFVIKSG